MTTKKSTNSDQLFDFRTITTPESAFRKQGMDPAVMPDISMLPERFSFLTVVFLLSVVIEAVNNGWRADFSNHNQRKYFVYGWVSSSGLDFSYSNFSCDGAIAIVGFPLYVETSEKARFIFEQFPELYKAWLINVKP